MSQPLKFKLWLPVGQALIGTFLETIAGEILVSLINGIDISPNFISPGRNIQPDVAAMEGKTLARLKSWERFATAILSATELPILIAARIISPIVRVYRNLIFRNRIEDRILWRGQTVIITVHLF